MLLLLGLLSFAPVYAQSTPAKVPLQLGTISGGTESKTWKSDKATKVFPDMVREQIDGVGPNRLDIDLLQLTMSMGFLSSSTGTFSEVRYRVTTPKGEVVYDKMIQATYRTGSKETWSFSVDPVFAIGYGENLRRNVAQFIAEYAAGSTGSTNVSAEGDKPTSAAIPAEVAAPVFPKLAHEGKGKGKLPRGGNATLCYTIDTQPGEHWQVFLMQQGNLGPARIGIAADNSCSSETPAEPGAKVADVSNGGYGYYTVNFVAGGGPYVVFVRPSGSREYIVTASRMTGDPGKLQPLPQRAEMIAAYKRQVALAEQARAYLSETKVATASTSPVEGRSTRKAGSAFRDCSDGCPEMVVVRAGSFLMGSNSGEMDRGSNEGPQHRVTFARSFAVGKYEVTGEEWDACVAAKGCAGKPLGTGANPAQVTWSEARTFAAWLTEKTGQSYALLSEAEWEYATRAGTDTPWNTGDGIITDDANIMDQFKQVVKVGGFPANAFGLHDMHGNAGEWVLDCIDVGYFGVPSDGGAAVTPNCPARVWRGGNFASMPREVRSAWRGSAKPDARIGFRLGRAL